MSEALIKKLRLDASRSLTVLNRPKRDYFPEFEVLEQYPETSVDVIVLFVKSIEELKEETYRLIQNQVLKPGGRLLIAYPKKGNKIFDSYIGRDDIFPALEVGEDGYIGDSDWKFNQMASLDETYTILGVKRVKRGAAEKAADRRTKDYAQYVPQVIERLAGEKKALAFFKNLAPGYQKSWARYVYSARQTSTRERRIQEMIGLLNRGIKSKEGERLQKNT